MHSNSLTAHLKPLISNKLPFFLNTLDRLEQNSTAVIDVGAARSHENHVRRDVVQVLFFQVFDHLRQAVPRTNIIGVFRNFRAPSLNRLPSTFSHRHHQLNFVFSPG